MPRRRGNYHPGESAPAARGRARERRREQGRSRAWNKPQFFQEHIPAILSNRPLAVIAPPQPVWVHPSKVGKIARGFKNIGTHDVR